ncbi:MAG: EamA family transporter [Microcella sp.]|uniref:EamA family transporter n=1 Tax=Microcella sp. TaxID=1913979 RepID=UPI0024C7CD1D|nr:EamA family transporter [Microcella sp.]UYN83240.1 MAG: EamA family transporter [Microcella sp.]
MPSPPAPAARAAPAPALLAVLAIVSVQFGNAIAGSFFEQVGPLGAAALRLALAAALLLIVIRPRVREWPRRTWLWVGMLGLALAGMNVLIYQAIASIPIGVAVTIELLGPLAVAVAATRRWRDLVWVALAALGVVALGLDEQGALEAYGVIAALGAAVFWALYIIASARLGPRVRGVDAIAVSMVIAAIMVVPIGVAPAVQAVVIDPMLLVAFAGIAVMTSALPYALEFLALKRMPTRVFGVISSLGPAVAALAGLLVLGQALGVLQLVAIAAVVIACAGAVATSAPSAAVRPVEPPPG